MKGKKGTRLWTCDGCGKQETWRKGWGHYHPIPSFANPGFPLVTYSDACDDVALAKVADAPKPVAPGRVVPFRPRSPAKEGQVL